MWIVTILVNVRHGIFCISIEAFFINFESATDRIVYDLCRILLHKKYITNKYKYR